MSFKLHRVHVWSGEVKDEPGGVAAKLLALARAGANLEYVDTRRLPDQEGAGILYVSPLTGPEQLRAAKAVGLHETQDPIVMRLEGDNTAGLAHRLTRQWELSGINLHGMVMSVLGTKFIGYVTFDSVEDANRAATILAEVGTADPPPAKKAVAHAK
jgi:hypothetical protein